VIIVKELGEGSENCLRKARLHHHHRFCTVLKLLAYESKGEYIFIMNKQMIIRHLCLIAFVFLIISCIHIDDMQKEIGIAYNLIEELKYKEAYEKLNRVLRVDPENSEALNYKGLAALAMGKSNEAIKCLNKAFEIDSTNVENNLNLGVYYAWNNNVKNAKKFYKKAIALDSMCTKAYTNLGVLATKEGRFKESFILHEKAISIDPELGGCYTNRGETYLATGDTLKAMADFKTALQRKANLNVKLYTLCRRGMIYRSINDYQSAINDFSEAINLIDYDMNMYYYRGLSYAGLYNYKLALKDFYRAKKLGKNNIDRLIEECNRFL
jgi:tetratricopeptide (TPR) repeat protein